MGLSNSCGVFVENRLLEWSEHSHLGLTLLCQEISLLASGARFWQLDTGIHPSRLFRLRLPLLDSCWQRRTYNLEFLWRSTFAFSIGAWLRILPPYLAIADLTPVFLYVWSGSAWRSSSGSTKHLATGQKVSYYEDSYSKTVVLPVL